MSSITTFAKAKRKTQLLYFQTLSEFNPSLYLYAVHPSTPLSSSCFFSLSKHSFHCLMPLSVMGKIFYLSGSYVFFFPLFIFSLSVDFVLLLFFYVHQIWWTIFFTMIINMCMALTNDICKAIIIIHICKTLIINVYK